MLKTKKNIICSILFIFFITLHPAFSQIKILSPLPSDTLLTGEELVIQWTGSFNNAPVNILYSTNFGTSWLIIADSVRNNFYKWTIPILDTLNFMLKVETSFQIPPSLIYEIKKAHNSEIRSAEFSPDGRFFLTCGSDAFVKIWDVSTQKTIDSLQLTGRTIWASCFHHGSDTVVIAVDSFAVVWYRNSATQRIVGQGDFSKQTRSCSSNPFKDVFAVGSYDGSTKLYSASTGTLNSTFPANSEVYSTAFSKDGKYLAYGTYTGDLFVYEWENSIRKDSVRNSAGNSQVVWACGFSKDSRYVAAGGVDTLSRVWDVQSGQLQDSFRSHTSFVRSLMFHPNNRYLMTASLDGFLKQRDFFKQRSAGDDIYHGGQILSAGYSPTADSLISAGRDSTVRLWKNFKDFYYADSIAYLLKYPVAARIPHLYSKIGSRLKIPLLFENPLNIPHVLNSKYNIQAEIEIPRKLLDIRSQVSISNSATDRDTVSLSFNNISLKDTIAVLYALVLQGTPARDDIKILKFTIDYDTNLVIRTYNGSISLEETCIGTTSRAILLTGRGVTLEVSPNPASDAFNTELNLIENGHYSIEIINTKGQIVEKIFEGNLKSGKYSMIFNSKSLNCGKYLVIMKTPTKIITKSVIIFR